MTITTIDESLVAATLVSLSVIDGAMTLVDKDSEVEWEELIELVVKSDEAREELAEVGGTVIVVVTVVVICWEVINT